jgi:putative mRNA 3-end processing factor
LLAAIAATGAERIGVTHGQLEAFTRWLREQGRDAFAVPTRFTGEGLHEGLASTGEEGDSPTDDA